MPEKKFHLHDGKVGSALAVRITPRARKNEVVEIQGDGTVRIRLTSSGADEDANKALIAFLAELLSIPMEKIDIVAGKTGKDKLVSILDIDTTSIQKLLLGQL